MRVVYDDTRQMKAYEHFLSFLADLRIKDVIKYSNGMNRISGSLVKQYLNNWLESFDMNIGNDVYNAYGIGNNCKYPLYYNDFGEDEKQICAYININTGMFGECYVSLEDYDRRKIGETYELTSRGIKKYYRG